VNRRRFLAALGAALAAPFVRFQAALAPPPASLALSLDAFTKRYFEPQLIALANELDRSVFEFNARLPELCGRPKIDHIAPLKASDFNWKI
jgi:hypothetical protein